MAVNTKNRAFTMVELLISLAITALLLASVAVGVHAYLKSYRDNERLISLMDTSRFVLSRMMIEARAAADLDSTAGQLTITPIVDGSGLQQIQYEYAGGQLHYRQTANGQQTDQVLIGDGSDDITISEFSVIREDDAEGIPVSVKMRLVLTRGNESFPLTASAVIRRNQKY
ncbi:MAG: prepilin-type N-terminal cleavage/methylation domain-containing protein [Planctomycetota bacterium]|nr:prepilin-type N-terminal cleavage/methylation domain-containing protein [Planctomycetota bacterium]